MLKLLSSKRGSAISIAMRSASTYNAGIDVSALEVHRTAKPKTKLPNEKLAFGKTFSDHMLEVDWDNVNGWAAPVIRPYGPIPIDPAASSLHYALQVRFIIYIYPFQMRLGE